ncbi:MAG TPA: hypothetical protein VJ962_12770 [Clostridia bacterium]|nr:hypothetical protein [Clostridia bacterium]
MEKIKKGVNLLKQLLIVEIIVLYKLTAKLIVEALGSKNIF